MTSDIRVKSIPHFERWIDWEKSPRAAEYRSSLLKRLYHSSGPEAPRAQPRYYVTTPTYFAGALRRLLPTRALDWVMRR